MQAPVVITALKVLKKMLETSQVIISFKTDDFSNIKMWKQILSRNQEECPPCWQGRQMRENRGRRGVTGHRMLCESQTSGRHDPAVYRTQLGPLTVPLKLRKASDLPHVSGPGTWLLWDTLHSSHVKWNCPAYSPSDHWVRKSKSLSFREELKVKFGVFYETVIFLSKFKFLLHR